MAWDPAQSDLCRRQRRRPAEDLLAAAVSWAATARPGRIADLGCGGGDLANRLAGRWPEAEVTGIDGSAAMLEQARQTATRVIWQQADLAQWQPARPFGLIVSNAALHWLGDHRSLFRRLLAALVPGGVLAVQMPRNFAAPSLTLLAHPPLPLLQILGHSKTVIVLLGGWLLYNDAVGPSKLIGMAVTAAGLAFYARGVTKGSSSSTCGGRWVGRGVGRGVGGRAAALTAFL